MKLITHKNGFQYSVPETVVEARLRCGTSPTRFSPWIIPDINKPFSTDVIETLDNKTTCVITSEKVRFGPVTTWSHLTFKTNLYGTKNQHKTHLFFEIDGDTRIWGVTSKDIHARNHVVYTDSIANNATSLRIIMHDPGSQKESKPYEKYQGIYLIPGGLYSNDLGLTHIAWFAGSTSSPEAKAAQNAVDLFNEHVLVLNKVWKSWSSRVEQEKKKAQAESQGLTVQELKEKVAYKNKVMKHAARTKKTMQVMPGLIEAKNALDDFINMLNNDEAFEPKDAAKIQGLVRQAADTISSIRDIGKCTL